MSENRDIKILTNTVSRQDFIYNSVIGKSICDSEILIASAFFTDNDIIEELAKQNNKINLVVRLGYPTSSTALKKISKYNNVSVCFFTSNKFHPKLYIYDDFVLVGSANLTHSAFTVNQEIMLKIDSSNHIYDDLRSVFQEYWDSAEVLTEDYITKYEKYINENPHISDEGEERGIEKILGGKFEYRNITIKNNDGRTKYQRMASSFRKDYEDCHRAISDFSSKYVSFGKRHVSEQSFPVKLEFDSFLSWIYDTKASGEKWIEQVPQENIDNYLSELFNNWMNISYHALERTENSYPIVKKLFSSENAILSSDFDTIIDVLICLHSVNTRRRFFRGGLEFYANEFKQKNTEKNVKDSLIYLFFGKGDIIDRMYDLIYRNGYKLNQFGKSNVQELVGWVCEDFPIINGRTTKMLHYFGYNVRQISDV